MSLTQTYRVALLQLSVCFNMTILYINKIELFILLMFILLILHNRTSSSYVARRSTRPQRITTCPGFTNVFQSICDFVVGPIGPVQVYAWTYRTYMQVYAWAYRSYMQVHARVYRPYVQVYAWAYWP